MSEAHVSVLLEEAIEALAPRPDGIYVDGTFGRGGHSRALLQRLGPQGRVIAFDRDPEAIAHGRAWSEPRLLGLGYAYEQRTLARTPPRFHTTLRAAGTR